MRASVAIHWNPIPQVRLPQRAAPSVRVTTGVPALPVPALVDSSDPHQADDGRWPRCALRATWAAGPGSSARFFGIRRRAGPLPKGRWDAVNRRHGGT